MFTFSQYLTTCVEATDKELDIKDLEKMIKNPDRKRVKSYGGTKYVDMLKSKLAKLKESTDLEEGKKVVASVELWNGKKMKKSFAKQSAAEAWVKKMEDNEDVRDYKMHAESTDLEEAATWKSEGHYTADGKEWTGDQHEVDGQVMTGKVHSDDSVDLYHFKELTPEVRKQVAASFE